MGYLSAFEHEELAMDIVRNADGTLVVPIAPVRVHDDDASDGETTDAPTTPETRVLHPGEGGYDEALTEWDRQQNPDAEPPVSTSSGREEAMHVLHEVAESPGHDVAPAVESLDDPEAAAEALRHVLIGGQHAVEDFASETASAEGGEPLKAHEATKIIGEVLAELD
jgi:hypothetical protein